MEGSYQGKPTKLIYGVFTTPENAIGGNAICAFKVLKFPFLLMEFDESCKHEALFPWTIYD